ncbi:hypothetical protein VTK73DRAFT_1271 [Phialemonium thermophilum]|uniref:Uncharacterized protein n=1 Tax=Phialemonium thermophilum TaxID=223376 RepID=A0ABR3XA20_9PEZI
MPPAPLFWSPALPSHLLAYVLATCTYPTTLIICSTRESFVSCLVDDFKHRGRSNNGLQPEREQESPLISGDGDKLLPGVANDVPDVAQSLLSSTLSQVAIAKHIRLVFVPTVSHLRVSLSHFSATSSEVSAPPSNFSRPSVPDPRLQTPFLIVFGFLELHRNTSEWSAQGISNTAAALVDAAVSAEMKICVIEPALGDSDRSTLDTVIGEAVPVLSRSALRAVSELDEARWTGRTVEIRQVLGRWFRFRTRNWANPFVEPETL